MASWYAIHLGTSEPMVSPISHQPFVFNACDKDEAERYVSRVFPYRLVEPMSVCEYEAMWSIERAAIRAKERDDALLAYAKTLPVPEEYDEPDQMTLCSDAAMWSVAA